MDEVKSGNLTYKIPIDPDKPTDELSRLAKGINEISEASNVAVQNELKNQRMKTELMSNVSHDLKTPLKMCIRDRLCRFWDFLRAVCLQKFWTDVQA